MTLTALVQLPCMPQLAAANAELLAVRTERDDLLHRSVAMQHSMDR